MTEHPGTTDAGPPDAGTATPGTGDLGAGHPAGSHPVYGRPTLGELVAAVRESLADAAAGQGPPLSGFRARVAANVLAMVERELARGAADQQAYAAALARLGVADEAELAAEIRAGRRDRELAELAAAYRHIVAARLAVAHPGYATPPADTRGLTGTTGATGTTGTTDTTGATDTTGCTDAAEPGGAAPNGSTARDRTGEDHAAG